MVAGLKLDAGRVSCYLRSADVVLDEYYADQDEVEQENEDEEAANQEDLDGSSSSSSSISDGSDQDGDTTTTPHRQKHSKRKLPPATKKDMVLVDIDIYESAYANAHRYFDAKKTAVYKQEKTVEMATKVLKVSEKKIIDSLKAAQQTTVSAAIVKARKPFWFEKYLWFISSENYLVVGGRDAIQNEALVKKHLNKGDVYVHADLHGASSVIVKNPYTTRSSSADDGGGDGVIAETNPDDYNVSMLPPPAADGSFSISPITLHQAGTMSVCMSKAWDSKIVTSAWWVESDQVSKTAPSGEVSTKILICA